ncbi:phenazine biosynthesis-like domain-containing protein 1 [Uloborus diversus]|uniref:phenazine biosynthesis-like domain-containing protein 1 n=1 Tax=Uloborus diversus TaxID=327109 RepID=UPI002409380D|nr:phenazine biosynthesis-like domain-containing protein 1 [Uloborus diversus]
MDVAKQLEKSTLPIFIVDAFTKKPFAGNGAAICLVSYQEEISNEMKQKMGAEMNLSETAFISIIKKGDTFQNGNRFKLQWFTPTCEVSLCGHATLASSAVLFTVCGNESQIIEFETLSGVLKAKRLPDGRIEIDLPAYESVPVDMEIYGDVVKAAIGSISPQAVVLSYSKKLLIQLPDNLTRHQLESLKPKQSELLEASSNVVGVIITLKSSGKDNCCDEEGNSFDFISRYFAPWLGVFEDPVTGSAHSVLGPYWSKILKKNKLYARQCSPRGGNLHVECLQDRVHVSGNATIVVQGQISF